MYQQRRTAPAVSAYESQAARWKQGFSAPGQPGHPQQPGGGGGGGGARNNDLEVVLIGELCSSVGSSSFPPRDVLQKLVRHLPSLDHSYVCELLDDKLLHRLWQVQGKALSVLDAVLKTTHAEPYKQHYYARIALLQELVQSRKDIVKNRAEKVLAVVSTFVPPPPAIEPPVPPQLYEQHEPAHQQQPQYNAYYYQQQQQQQHQQRPHEIDLLHGFDEPSYVTAIATHAEPAAQQQSAFGFITAPTAHAVAAAAAAPQLSPIAAAAASVPSAPPMTVSGFGFINAPAPVPHAATPAPAATAHLSSTSPPPHDRPLRVEDLSTSMHQQRPPQPQQQPNNATAPQASAFAFLAPAAPAAPQSPVVRPVGVWDTLPAPTPTAIDIETPPLAKEIKVHDPIHDAFEGLDSSSLAVSSSSSTDAALDALDHTHVSLETPYPDNAAVYANEQTLREVILDIELPPGPMGLVLDRTITNMAVIERFIPLPNGDRGYLEYHPAICPGCALLSINNVNVEHQGLDEVGPTLAAFAHVPKVLRFKKLMNNGRTANPSTLRMPYVPPPPEEDELAAAAATQAHNEHMARLKELETSLNDVEAALDDLIRREQLQLPISDKKNQLAQLHGDVETIQTQGIDAVILGPNPPPNSDDVKAFRSSLVRRADALTKRIQHESDAVTAAPVAPPTSPVSAFSFVSSSSNSASDAAPPQLTLPSSVVAAPATPASSFAFMNASPSTPPALPAAAHGTSSFSFMEESATPPVSSFAFLQQTPAPTPVAPLASVFEGLSVRDESPASIHAASTMSAGPLTLSALGMGASTSNDRTHPTPASTPASSMTSSSFGFLTASLGPVDGEDADAAPPAVSSPTAFGFLRASGGSTTSSNSSGTSEAPAAASAFNFIQSVTL